MKNDLIIFLAKYLIIVIAAIGAVYWLGVDKKRKLGLAASVILGVLTALILAKIFSKLYYHPRPFVVKHVAPLVAHGNDNGFPSEHTTVAAAMAAVAYFYHKKLGISLIILALLVGAARIWANVHSPLDIIGGLIAGLLGGISGYYIAHRIIDLSGKKTGQ